MLAALWLCQVSVFAWGLYRHRDDAAWALVFALCLAFAAYKVRECWLWSKEVA